VDVPALAKSERRGLEDAARVGRYRALSGLARRVRASAILTGHTRSDSVETMLLHLLRGSGPRGLRGIEPSERLDPALVDGVDCLGLTTPRVVRPLLDVDRADTAAYCTARGIEWRTDPTNGDLAFTRNRVRHHLLPVLRTYNPAIDAGLERLAQMARDEEHWIDGLVERAFVRLGRQEPVGVAFEIGAWRRQLLALRRRLVLRVADRYGIADVGFDAVERALAVAEEHGPPRTELGNGLEVERTGNQIVFRLRRGKVG